MVKFLIVFGLLLSLFVNAESSKEGSKKEGEYRGAKTATHPNWFKESFLDLEEDIADATESNKRLVVYFWQPGCPYCSQLWEENFAQQEIVKFFRKNFEIVALNMWGSREVVSVAGNDYTEKSFSEALGIEYTPTLLFFDENKKVIHQMNGFVPPESFKLALEYVAGRHEKEGNIGVYAASLESEKQLAEKGELNKETFFLNTKDTPLILDRTVENKEKYLAVFFESKNCKNCDLLHQKTLQDAPTRELVKNFVSVQLDRFSDTAVITPSGDKTTAKEWANELNISYLPATIFFDSKGKEVMRIDAQMRTFHVQSVYDFVLSGAYKTETNFQRWISARADKMREHGVDVDIWAY